MRDARRVWLAGGVLLVLGCVALAVWFPRQSEPTLTGTVRAGAKILGWIVAWRLATWLARIRGAQPG